MANPESFPLPHALAQKLRGVSNTLHNGRGFAVIRGLAVNGRSDEDNVIAHVGIGSYIGRDRATNSNGMAMGENISFSFYQHSSPDYGRRSSPRRNP